MPLRGCDYPKDAIHIIGPPGCQLYFESKSISHWLFCSVSKQEQGGHVLCISIICDARISCHLCVCILNVKGVELKQTHKFRMQLPVSLHHPVHLSRSGCRSAVINDVLQVLLLYSA